MIAEDEPVSLVSVEASQVVFVDQKSLKPSQWAQKLGIHCWSRQLLAVYHPDDDRILHRGFARKPGEEDCWPELVSDFSLHALYFDGQGYWRYRTYLSYRS